MQQQLQPACVSQVLDLLKLEANAILQTADRLRPDQVQRAIDALTVCSGKVILIGVGKSGIVGRKIAATLTSTGTHAIYLHPADALHGDLGIVTSQDVAIALSNSGETDELLAILPYLKQRRVPIIAIVGNPHSTLSRAADATLDASVDQEACPFNLAPTTSTTVALAIGDAIAMTLMQVKALTPEDFAINHPAGRLGKRLTLRVQDLMLNEPKTTTVRPTATWLEVLQQITIGGAGALSVVDEADRLIGIITDGDLRRWIQKIDPRQLHTLNAGIMMTKNPTVVSPDLLAYDALQLMENRPSQISVLPIVDQDQQYLGLIRLHDIIRSGL
ncbi:KpsF/GutQ family sugar-phosphate isomerase [Leptolyngbya sp. NIES-2104]|uniref:KpsF/GutQ family sugar-phosphate isomerase n=1 Tax=Leptolyngbya sp. NIES-2104 TaxID=1552121 RepID=UPI0006EC55AA|nr:KpsF/GutQ family sugar-phosphate isomerase [Leptolyngbya sp. NIES-2104]GAP97606.1 arabinose 5-phosphate isomerase [Leptolyngbya sp. NIES-2104]